MAKPEQNSSRPVGATNGAGPLARAKAFFERAEEVARTDNFDYAIDMFIEGLRCAPDAVTEGHKPLRHIALIRQGKGGKKPSITERLKRGRGKTALEQMLNAEFLLAKDLDNLQHAEAMMKAALQGGYRQTTEWIADLIFQAHCASDNAPAQAFVQLKDAYAAVGLFEKAIAACRYAAKLRPDDDKLKDELRDLSAQFTVARGRYGQEGDFRDSIKDREEQAKLQAQERVVKTRDYRLAVVADAREVFAQNPHLATNIFRLADALADLAEDESENEAIELLQTTYSTTKDFSFKRHSGEIRLKQLRRKARAARDRLEAAPAEGRAKAELEAMTSEMDKFELDHLRLCVDNYPTDLWVKYQYGLCLMRNERYDDAIPLLQEARKDPRHAVEAMNKMGLCFFLKGWLQDAVDIFKQATKIHEIPDDELAKELRYNLGRVYEQLGNLPEALELYRKIAQIDYSYKDVRQRVDKLRETPEAS